MTETLGYSDVEFLETEDEEAEEEEVYEDEEVGPEIPAPKLIFGDEVREILNAEPQWTKMIPRWFRAQDGTRFLWKSVKDEEEVELVLNE
jgi:hypothetical protein